MPFGYPSSVILIELFIFHQSSLSIFGELKKKLI